MIYAGADAGEATEQEADLLARSLLSAGVDATVHSFAWALHAFASDPEQWDAWGGDVMVVVAVTGRGRPLGYCCWDSSPKSSG